ncbi:GNAT family N-acetyltransferase [Acrocarpospora catenulata]|uniref:GNAT family N-acetyltransferase n=1 Tax=Acrocarpospora catenulata TaxID=2836182 RepID=UPI001BD93E3A|nr:GNAT family N-acetyltransferase [Acrocarpospora catenulata]
MYDREPLDQEHRLDVFDCGKEVLNDWLKMWALHAQKNRTARTFVWTSAGSVVAYYSLAGHLLQKDELPARVGRGGPRQIPAIILARLALDSSLHGQGRGARLLVDALSTAVESSHRVAARLVVVDALDDEAVAFYEKFGFIRIPGDMRLIRKMSDIEADLKG